MISIDKYPVFHQSPLFDSSWKDEQVRSVNWAKLPTTRSLKWHEITKIRTAVSYIFIISAAVTSAAILFTATPLTCASLFIGSLALLAAGIYLRMQKNHLLDPDFRMKERDTLQNSIHIPHIGMLNSLVINFIITKNEKQALLHQDIYDTDYEIFTEKHGQIIFDELDDQNLELLRLKFLDYLTICEIRDLADIQDILNSKANQYFNFTEDDLMSFLPIEDDLEEVEDDLEKSNKNKSILTQMTSQISSYAFPIIKLATNIFVPSTLKSAAQLAAASAQLAYQGKTKASAIYALGALNCLFIHSAKSMMKTLYPDAYEITKQQMMYEKTFDSKPGYTV